MKVKQSVLDKLSTSKGLGLIMMTLDCSHTTARNLVLKNEDNSDLTKAVMTKAIREEFGYGEIEEVLVDSGIEAQS